MSYQNNRPSQNNRETASAEPLKQSLLDKINLNTPSADMFDTLAETIAKEVSEAIKGNLSTQLRRFYDEVCQWHQRVEQSPAEFSKFLPFIRMINAKVAYAHGRELVDKKFVSLIQDCLRKVEDAKSFNNFKLFFEAFLGFYKIHKSK